VRKTLRGHQGASSYQIFMAPALEMTEIYQKEVFVHSDRLPTFFENKEISILTQNLSNLALKKAPAR